MAVSRGLQRLLHVLGMEEEQRRTALEAAVAHLRRMEAARAVAEAREREGRRLVAASAATGELTDRVAGLEETRFGRRSVAALKSKIAAAMEAVEECRREFTQKRVERRQAETLIDRMEAKEAVEAGRRGQRELDDWFLNARR